MFGLMTKKAHEKAMQELRVMAEAHRENAAFEKARADSNQQYSDAAHEFHNSLMRERFNLSKANTALRKIADMETPGANATVKRMAAAAREALPCGGAEKRLEAATPPAGALEGVPEQ